MAALDRLDIADLAAKRADNLSGGQQQRVAICRALVQEPEIVLADEPVASLDPRNAQIVMDALQRINRHFGLTVLCNLHSLDLARRYCDRLVGMAGGRVVFDDVPAALTEAVARELYGLEANEVMPEPGSAAISARCAAAQPGLRRATHPHEEPTMIDRRTLLAGLAAGAATPRHRPRPELQAGLSRSSSSPSFRPRTPPA